MRLAPLVGADPVEENDFWDAALELFLAMVADEVEIKEDDLDQWLPFELAAMAEAGLISDDLAPDEFEIPFDAEEYWAWKEPLVAKAGKENGKGFEERVLDVLREYLDWTPEQEKKHPRDAKGRFRKKLGAVGTAIRALTPKQAKARAKEVAEETTVFVPTPMEEKPYPIGTMGREDVAPGSHKVVVKLGWRRNGEDAYESKEFEVELVARDDSEAFDKAVAELLQKEGLQKDEIQVWAHSYNRAPGTPSPAPMLSPKELARRRNEREDKVRELVANSPAVQAVLADPAVGYSPVNREPKMRVPSGEVKRIRDLTGADRAQLAAQGVYPPIEDPWQTVTSVEQLDPKTGLPEQATVKLAVEQPLAGSAFYDNIEHDWYSSDSISGAARNTPYSTLQTGTWVDPRIVDPATMPEGSAPLEDQLLRAGDVEAFLQNEAGTPLVGLTAKDIERLRAGERLNFAERVARGGSDYLEEAPWSEQPRPGRPGYVARIERPLSEIAARSPDFGIENITGLMEAHPVQIARELEVDTAEDMDARDGRRNVQYIYDWRFKFVKDPQAVLPGVKVEPPGRATMALVQAKRLRDNRREVAAREAAETEYNPHGAGKDRAMRTVAESIDLTDPDVRAFKSVADIIIDPDEFSYGDTPAEKLAGAIIQSWARSSSDEHTWGHFMQWAAAQEFGVELNDWVGGPRFKELAPGMWACYQYLTDESVSQDVVDMMDSPVGFHSGDAFGADLHDRISPADVPRAQVGARKVLRAMYEAAQRDLDELGADEFLLWRGMSNLEETRVLGEINLVKPDAISHVRDPGGSYTMSLRFGASEGVAAMFPDARRPIPLDSKNPNLGYYWPPFEKLTPEDRETVANALPGVDEYGMIDRRVAISEATARALAGVPDNFLTQSNPVRVHADGSYLNPAPGLKPQPNAMSLDPAVAQFLEDVYRHRGSWDAGSTATKDTRSLVNYVANWRADIEFRDLPSIDPDDEPALIGSDIIRKWQARAERALAALEEMGYDVAPVEETQPRIEAALADPEKVVPWLREHKMLDPITIKQTSKPGWLMGGVHVADDVRANPMSSHATTQQAANQFEGPGGGFVVGVVAKEDIIGMPGAGYGCLNEDEVVVIGKPRRYVVIPHGTEIPGDMEIADLIEHGEVTTAPDIQTGTRAQPSELPLLAPDDAWLAKHIDVMDAFVYTEPTGTGYQSYQTVNLSPLAKWIDQSAGRDDSGRILISVGTDGYFRSDVTGEVVHVDLPEGIEPIGASDLEAMIKEAQDRSDKKLFGGVPGGMTLAKAVKGQKPAELSIIDAPGLHAPLPPHLTPADVATADWLDSIVNPPESPFEADPEVAWSAVIAGVKENLLTDEPHAAQFAQVIEGIVENNPDATFKLISHGPPAVIQHEKFGDKYEFPGLTIHSQQDANGAVLHVKAFFAPSDNEIYPEFPPEKPTPFSPIPQDIPDPEPPLDNQTGAEYLKAIPGGVAVLDPWGVKGALREFFEQKGQTGISTSDAYIEAAAQVFTELNTLKVKHEISNLLFSPPSGFTVVFADGSEQTFEFPDIVQGNIDSQGFWWLIYQMGDVLPGLLTPAAISSLNDQGFDWKADAYNTYAEADPVVSRGYIFIDGPENADWPKQTWDFWGVDSPAELDAYLAREHMSAEHFKTQPVFLYNVEKLPWLKEWASAGRDFAWSEKLHPRFPKGDKRGGRFRPKLGGLVKAFVHPRASAAPGQGARGKYVSRSDKGITLAVPGAIWHDLFDPDGTLNFIRFEKNLREQGVTLPRWLGDIGLPEPSESKRGGGSTFVYDGLTPEQARETLEYVSDRYENYRLARVEPVADRATRWADTARAELDALPDEGAVDPDLLKDIDDILDELGIPPAPEEDEEEEIPEVEVKQAKVDPAIEAARAFLAKPKLKFPGADDARRKRDAREEVVKKRRPYYEAAAKRAGAKLDELTKDLKPGEYLYVHGPVREPLEENSNDMGYLFVPGKGWTYAKNLRWRPSDLEDRPPQFRGVPTEDWDGSYVLWGDTGPSLEDRPVEKTGKFSFESTAGGAREAVGFAGGQPSSIAEIVLGGLMTDRQSLAIFSPDDTKRLDEGRQAAGREKNQREHDMLDAVREAAGDWLGYGDTVTDDEVREFLEDFKPGTTIGRDPRWPKSDDMWVRKENGKGWNIFARREDEWGWEETAVRELTDEEALAEAGPALRRYMEQTKRKDQALDFRMEIDAVAQRDTGPQPTQLPNGAPGPMYVAQHEELMRVGEQLDTRLQGELSAMGTPTPEEVRLKEAWVNALSETLKTERQSVQEANAPIAFDIFADEFAAKTGMSREDAAAYLRQGFFKRSGMGTVWAKYTHEDWLAWGRDPDAWGRERVPQDMGRDLLGNEGTTVSAYQVGEIARTALLVKAGFYDLSAAERQQWPHYGDEYRIGREIAEGTTAWNNRLTLGRLDELHRELDKARDELAELQLRPRVAFRDAALKVLREVREIGGGPKPSYHKRVKKDMREAADVASDLYPKDWQERLDGEGQKQRPGHGWSASDKATDLYITATKVRGRFEHWGGPDSSDRIWASPGSGGLPDQPMRERFDTIVHELGHRFEAYMPELGAAEWTFWHYLARDRSFDFENAPTEPITKMKTLNRRRLKKEAEEKGETFDPRRVLDYKPDEVGIMDRLPNEYIGKVYSGGGKDRYWEILTMLVEDMMTGGQHYLRDDPELRRWVLGVLAGI